MTNEGIQRAEAGAAMTKARCSICNGVLHEYGRSAQPMSDGLCCTQCNQAHVIPARLARLQAWDGWRPFEPLRIVAVARTDARVRGARPGRGA